MILSGHFGYKIKLIWFATGKEIELNMARGRKRKGLFLKPPRNTLLVRSTQRIFYGVKNYFC